jgi:DUF4097 and DUF4098 domain-containing protein YvlB
MKIKWLLLLIITGLFAFSSLNCSLRRYEKRETSEYKINLTGKNKVTLDNVSGTIKVIKGDSATGLIVKAEKIAKVKKRDLDKPFTEAAVEIDTSSDAVHITSEIEKDKSFFKFQIGSGTKINYTITLPPGVKFSVDNTNGSIELNDLTNDLDVSVVNGSVEINKTSGENSFDITNGKLKGSMDSTKGLTVNIVNGGVDFNLGKNFTGNFKIETVNGRISQNDLEFTTVTSDRNSFKGKIGDSDKEIKIDVVNGKINLSGVK